MAAAVIRPEGPFCFTAVRNIIGHFRSEAENVQFLFLRFPCHLRQGTFLQDVITVHEVEILPPGVDDAGIAG